MAMTYMFKKIVLHLEAACIAMVMFVITMVNHHDIITTKIRDEQFVRYISFTQERSNLFIEGFLVNLSTDIFFLRNYYNLEYICPYE